MTELPFAHKSGECYWIWTSDPEAKLEQHRRMIRERERAYAEFRRLQNDKPDAK